MDDPTCTNGHGKRVRYARPLRGFYDFHSNDSFDAQGRDLIDDRQDDRLLLDPVVDDPRLVWLQPRDWELRAADSMPLLSGGTHYHLSVVHSLPRYHTLHTLI